MARSNVTFILGQGGLGQALAGLDHVRGLNLYGTAPGSFSATPSQAVFSLSDAETKGIALDYADETKAAATYLITNKGNTGDTVNMTVAEPRPNGTGVTVNLGTYTVTSGDSTIDLLGASLAAFINAGTYVHGYVASFNAATDTLTITARQGMGIALNTGSPLVFTIVGTVAGTLTQFTGGVYSKKAIWHYHVSEFFRANPKGKLWVNFTASASTTFAEVVTLQNAAKGECMGIGVYNPAARTATQFANDMTALEARVTDMFNAYAPMAMCYAPNIQGISDVATLTNLQAYSNKSVLPVIGQDGDAVGAMLFVTSGISISNIGNVLGTSSAAAVSQDIGEIGVFNLTDGTELVTPAFSNGELVSSKSSNVLDQLDGYRYNFICNYTGQSGTFFNNDFTAVVQSSDFNRLCRILPMYKAVRQTYTGVLPLLKSRLTLNTNGTLSNTTIEIFDSAINPNLSQMVTDGDLSDYRIVIDPAQNVLTTNKVKITLKLLPLGIADFIEVTLTYVAKLA